MSLNVEIVELDLVSTSYKKLHVKKSKLSTDEKTILVRNVTLLSHQQSFSAGRKPVDFIKSPKRSKKI